MELETPTPDISDDGIVDGELTEENMQVPEVHDDDLESDHEYDRDFKHELVGRKIKAIYSNGWFNGKVTWFNQKMNRLRVEYSDDTDDYISIDEIDGVEIALME